MSCDIRICSTEAYFGLFEVKRGIMAGYGVHHLMRLIPASAAYYTVFTADNLTPGIFSKIAGVLAAAGFQIVSAQIVTRTDGSPCGRVMAVGGNDPS